MSERQVKRHWTAVAVSPPALSKRQWAVSGVLGLVLVIMAITQLASIKDFESNFAIQGIRDTRALAIFVILAELWAAAGFFQIRLSWLFRKFSNGLALLVGLFWLGWSSYVVTSTFKFSSNFFGRFNDQHPGWWTVVEATLLITLITYLLNVMQNRSSAVLPVVTRINKRELKKSRR